MNPVGTPEREQELSEMRRNIWILAQARQYILGGMKYDDAKALAKTEAADIEREGGKF